MRASIVDDDELSLERLQDVVDGAVRSSEAAPDPEPRAELLNKVLVVDDDPSIRKLLAHFLNALGFESICCSSGVEALKQLELHRPRLIISDWEMPGMDGLELCRQVRTRSVAAHLHFIMLTTHAGKDQLAKAFDAGVDDFINKPVTDSELMARLRAGMRAIELHDDLLAQNKGSQQLNEQLTNLNSRLQKLAITDDLTGLYNRRQAMHRLEEHWSMCHRYQRPVAVVTLDIDHFKQINDQYGHIAGDAVLRGVADILRKCVRNSDVLSRVGGEEFLILLPCQTLQEAEICAHRCREAVASAEFHGNNQTMRVTISAGIATRRTNMRQCADLLKEADMALYAAKNAGRNTVRAAPVEQEAPASSAA